MQLTCVAEHKDPSVQNRWTGKVALLVDPDPVLLEAGKLLLSGYCESVQTASTCYDVAEMPHEEKPQVAVLSDRLGSFQLLAVAEYVRHRWPLANILVVGRAASFLDEHLYDRVEGVGSSNLEFLAAIDKYAKSPDYVRIESDRA